MSTENKNMTEPAGLEHLYQRLTETESDISTLSTDNAAIKVAVNHLTGAMDRIERKLDNPAIGPSWVSITSLFTSISAVIGGAVIGFVILTQTPIKANIESIKTDMLVDEERERSDSDILSTHTNDIKTLKENRDIIFTITSDIRSIMAREKDEEIKELRRALDHARGL